MVAPLSDDQFWRAGSKFDSTLASNSLAIVVPYDTRNKQWENLPHGPNRQFGGCQADRGVVVQNRDGETHVLAVAFNLRVTTELGWYEMTVVTTP